MKLDRKTIMDIAHTDLITIFGGKSRSAGVSIFFIIFFCVVGFAYSPLFVTYIPLMISLTLVPALFTNELKYHSEKLYCIVPVSRRDVVTARFIYVTALYIAVGAADYLLMLLSLRLKIYIAVLGGENFDIIGILSKRTGGMMSELGYMNLIYFCCIAGGAFCLANALRKYFRNSASIDMSLALMGMKITKDDKHGLIAVGIIAFIVIVWILIIEDILPFGAAAVLILKILIGLAQAADGFVLGAVLLTVSVFISVYCYICTILEYDEKEF